MTDDKRASSEEKTHPTADRRRRQAEALRANLRRRKAAGRGEGDKTKPAPDRTDKPRGAGT